MMQGQMNRTQTLSNGLMATALGLGAMALGSLLPWEVRSLGILSVTRSGLQGDGAIVLIVAVMALLFVLTRLRTAPDRPTRVLVAVLGLVGAGIAASSLFGLAPQGDVTISAGIGLYLSLAGGISAAVAAFLA